MTLRGFRLLLAALLAVAPIGAASLATSAATTGLEGIPHYDHVVVLIEENESASATFGSSSPATYLNGTLRPQATFDDQYYATGHVSLDNYISLTSGQPGIQGSTNTDCLGISLWLCAQLVSTPSSRNLADQLEENALSWAEFADGTTKPCVHDVYSPANPLTSDSYQGNGATPTNNGAGKDYADRHNPWIYYTDITGPNGNGPRCTGHVLPFTDLASKLNSDTLPAFSFITPDTCHDGHDAPCSGGSTGGLKGADDWLKGAGNVAALLSYLRSHNGLLILTFDEAAASDTSGCCHGGPLGTRGVGGRVGLLAFGPGVTAGRTIHTAYDHPALLRTIEDAFGISEHLNNAGLSSPMTDLFAASASNSAGGGEPSGGGGNLPNTSAARPAVGSGAGSIAAALLLVSMTTSAALIVLRGRGSRPAT